jgi:hypothetical protein
VVTGQPLPNDASRGSEEGTRRPKPKRVSALDAAAQVLADADQPLRAEGDHRGHGDPAACGRVPNGKTPEATLHAAMLREIKAKGAAARFRKVERGQFALAAGQDG